MPGFFVPKIEPDEWEAVYADMAKFANVGVPAMADRVNSITWQHDGVLWTATVGEQLHGMATIIKGRGRDKREIEVPRYANDTVLAIFPGLPFVIIHDNASRSWNLPIYANPKTTERFQ